MGLSKIISGGQTGVDRAALDAAIELGMDCGGWCPLGRRAEDGPIDPRYPLHETPARAYPQRTQWNVRDSDGTLIVTRGVLKGGTQLTAQFALKVRKPFMTLDLADRPDFPMALDWVRGGGVQILNVAGPRESQQPGIYDDARVVLERLFRAALAIQ